MVRRLKRDVVNIHRRRVWSARHPLYIFATLEAIALRANPSDVPAVPTHVIDDFDHSVSPNAQRSLDSKL